MESISRKEFREIIGWNHSNYPYSTSGLSLINGLSGAELKGAKIGESHYNLYYKYDVMKDIILFPIIITSLVLSYGDKCFIATNKNDLINFVANPILEKEFEKKVEKMPDCGYKTIRQHEIAFSNRIPYNELYDFNKEKFYGYRYVEF